MTVASTQSYIEYSGDGSTISFSLPFYFLLNTDISCIISTSDGVLSTQTNNVDFTVTGQGDAEGGVATFSYAPRTGYTILFYRDPPVTQETKYYENGKFPAASHEAALDKLTMLIQEYGWRFDSLVLKRPTFFADYYDAQQKRISNLATPQDDSDAATKNYADSVGSGANSYTDQKVSAEAQLRISADNLERDARAEADANFQKQLTGEVPLEASAFSVVSWHDQSVNNSIEIPDNKNAWSFGPQITVSPGQVITIGNESSWTIANGQEYEGVNHDLVVDNLVTSDESKTVPVDEIVTTQDIIPVTAGGTNASTAAAARTNLGLGNSSTLNIGTTSGTVAAGDDSRFSGRLISIKKITATAVYTPSTGLSFAVVKIVSGGAAGGSVPAQTSTTVGAASGGSSGSVAEVLLTAAQIGSSQTVTIGKGGTPVAGAAGNPGGASTFGSLISCPGGLGGLANSGISTATAYTATATPAQQAEPTVSTGISLLSLAPSTGGFGECHTTTAIGGKGGNSPYGIGGRESGSAGNAASGKGAGGGGSAVAASGAATTGGAGTDGYCLIYEYAGV